MIANQTDYGWQIIPQEAHALLASQIAFYWNKAQRSRYWPETLAAISDHDDGQDPMNRHTALTKAGTPMSFEISAYSVGQIERVLKYASFKSRWVALMIASHVLYIYRELQEGDPELKKVLKTARRQQKRWIKEIATTKQEVAVAYDIMQWCDRCSLILCQDKIPQDYRQLEVHHGPEQPFFISQKENKNLTVSPWPFEAEQFTVGLDFLMIEQAVFKSAKELKDKMLSDKRGRTEWTFEK